MNDKNIEKDQEKEVINSKIGIGEIKLFAKAKGKKVDDFLALTKANDPFYIQPNAIEKAKWFANVWNSEGQPKVHPRGLHYQILGKDYPFFMKGKDVEYLNTMQCWHYMEKGAKYARLLGLVPYEYILDMKNPKPENVPSFIAHSKFKPVDVFLEGDVQDLQIPKMRNETTEDFIEACVSDAVSDVFLWVEYRPEYAQPNYFEIWAEKGGVIPESIAREFNATMRPAGGGEFSLEMCHHAVNKAKQEKKNLHLFILADFDPKGLDMPKSVSRKVEKLARERGIKAYVHHVSLTKKQCIDYALPTAPAKEPKGNNKGYVTHSEIFKKYAGQDPTEINSFMAREPAAYREAIREAILPYYDTELKKRMNDELERLKDKVRERIQEKFDEIEPEINELRDKLEIKLEEFKKTVEPVIESKMEELELQDLIDEYNDLLIFDVKELIFDEEFEMPEAEVQEPKDALLDTTRSYLDQIKKYKEFDIR